MTDEKIIMDGQGITVEIWQNAKGEWQQRIKVTMPDDTNPAVILDTIAEIKKGLKERFGL